MINGILDWGSAHVTEDPVLNHPAMQRLRWVKQLGQIDGVNSRAVHTRFDHSGYAAHIAEKMCALLQHKGRLPSALIDIVTHTKLHDAGHPPFSHAVEYVLVECTNMNHNKKAVLLLDSNEKNEFGQTLADVIIENGGSVHQVRQLLKKEIPASAICNDKTVGADKLAYTLFDAYVCGFNQLPPAWQALIPHLTFIDNLGLDVSGRVRAQDDPISIACASQAFYFRMYNDLYLSSESLALERHIQKSVELAIKGGIIDPEKVWDFGDGALVHFIAHAPPANEVIVEAQAQMRRYTESGNVYQRAVAFKDERFNKHAKYDEVAEPIDTEFKSAFLRTFQKPSLLSELEESLGQELGTPLICSVLPDPQKLEPGDLALYSGARLVDTLSNYRPQHYAKLREDAQAEFAIRILVPKSEQDNTRRRSKDVARVFYAIAQDIIQRETAS